MQYFFSAAGDYLGGFDAASVAAGMVPNDAIEVQEPPAHGFDKLVNGQIVSYVDKYEALKSLFEGQLPEVQAQFYTLRAGVDLAMRNGQETIAKTMIEAAPVTDELLPVKAAMIAVFE